MGETNNKTFNPKAGKKRGKGTEEDRRGCSDRKQFNGRFKSTYLPVRCKQMCIDKKYTNIKNMFMTD